MPKQEDPNCYVFYKNRHALNVFIRCSSQWNMSLGMSGAIYTGLDYAGVDAVLRRSGLSNKKQNKVFFEVQEIERGALETLNQPKN